MDNKLYKIVRYYQDGRKARVMTKNLTLEKAQEWCQDPETSSMTAKKACHGSEKLINKWHALNKHWFDGYTEQ